MVTITRRNLITATAASAAAAAWPKPSPLRAQDAMNTAGQVPFYRTKLGSADITIVSDGTLEFPVDFMAPEVPEDELEGFLANLHQPTDTTSLQVNAMVIDLNGKRVLIDAGDGGKFQPTGGSLPDNLRAAGIDPATIDTVVFTHLHPDHLWGVTDADNEELVFANAEYVAADPELAFWDDPELPGHMPVDSLAGRIPDDSLWPWLAETTLAHLGRIEDRLRTVGATAEVSPGITFVPTHGHTPGHVSIMLESDGEGLLSTGDVLVNPLVSLERPEWGVGVDWDMEQGTQSRLALLDRAATDRLRVFGIHMPWPGFGHVARHGEAYRWIKEEWDWQA
jgi:glyoxylase-like metal-dependent hydrolase (beta-lactamase superfamily II)